MSEAWTPQLWQKAGGVVDIGRSMRRIWRETFLTVDAQVRTSRRLVVGGAAAILLAACGGTTALPSDIAVICAAGVGEPGKTVSTGSNICNDVTLGAETLAVDFSSPPTNDDLVEAYPGQNTGPHDAATFESGTAVLHSSGPSQEADVTPRTWLENPPPPSDVVVVVDFMGPSVGSTIGVAPRCSDGACIAVTLGDDGKFSFGDREGSTWKYPLTGDLNGDTSYHAPRLDPTKENRLIVWLSNGSMGAALNGRLLGTLKLKAPSVKQAFLFHRSTSDGKASQVSLTRIYFFAAAR